jgi:hypothetical protein
VNGHGFDLYSYDPGLTVPDGCKLLDASTILPRENVIFYPTDPGKGSVSQFSNTFRYKLLYEKGGWWVDMDVVCQTDRLPSGTYEFGYQDDGNEICTAVIKMPARDDLMHRCLTKAVETGSNAVWGQTGPVLFTHEISKAGLEHHAKSASVYYPYGWESAVNALDPAHTNRLQRVCSGSAFIHLWSEMLRRNEIDKSLPPRKGSFMGNLWEKYCDEGSARNGTLDELCSDQDCLSAASAIEGPHFHKVLNRLIASQYMQNTNLYIRATGRAPNYIKPNTFTEKMQCRKLLDRNPRFGIFCDKLKAHKYAAKKDPLIRSPHIIWTDSDPHQIPFNDLHIPCVIKPNHLSGSQYVIRHESHMDKAAIVRLCESWLNQTHGQENGEWGYSKVEPCIQVERLLPHPQRKPFPDHYEISVFSGRVEFIQHITPKGYFGRFTTSFDRDWNQLPVRKWTGWAEAGNQVRDYLTNVPKPAKLDQMIAVAECIADDIDHVRVDMYCVDDAVYLGELTPSAGSGYDYVFPKDAQYDTHPPQVMDHELGALWQQKQVPAILKLASVFSARSFGF